MSDSGNGSPDPDDREGMFDFIWDTDTELGREASAMMEEAYKDGEFTVEVE